MNITKQTILLMESISKIGILKTAKKKIVLNKYIKDSNFKNFIESDSNFTIEGCNESTRHYCFNCKIIDQEANHFDKIKKKMDC
jgi:hypothetical protein